MKKRVRVRGEKVIQRVGQSGEYWQTATGWWALNPQLGFVPVPDTSRALVAALSDNVGRKPACASAPAG
jgi:hypothetical protein